MKFLLAVFAVLIGIGSVGAVVWPLDAAVPSLEVVSEKGADPCVADAADCGSGPLTAYRISDIVAAAQVALNGEGRGAAAVMDAGRGLAGQIGSSE